ncbi:MAG: transglutaminase family protein [Deltaproteobacteria bacterium]|nr:transglutaminase family protein [Deltaproteobacteria bacterium]MBW2725760.1 transglutaminase family protein [Deltaproteobacteria bacterium]
MNDKQSWLQPTWFLDWEAPAVLEFARRATEGATSDRERASGLFYAVRDGLRYDPYSVNHTAEAYRASAIVEQSSAYCVPKAILLTALARSAGIPARLGFADVRNHLATPKLLERMGTDVFVYHGYSELYLDGRWLKAAPTFNKELCERFGVSPQDFDGTADALLHPFDAEGRRHMEYVKERGTFDDVPFEEMMRVLEETYGRDIGSAQDGSDTIFQA